MIADRLIDQLDGVRPAGPGRWIARCPAHEDKTPSLSIRETECNLLVHCFGGCDVYSVVSAVGLDLSDLFPQRSTDPAQRAQPLSNPISAADVLRCLAREATYVLLCASDMARGQMMTDADVDRLALAVNRIWAGMIAGGIA